MKSRRARNIRPWVRMFRSILETLLWFLLIALLVMALFLGMENLLTHPVLAAVTQIEDIPGHTLYRSQHSLKDQSGYAWQVVLFKQIESASKEVANDLSSLDLRLVGVPGAIEVDHPASLKITTLSGEVFTAPDVFFEDAPAPTIGEYNFKQLVAKLPTEKLQLTIPLIGGSVDLQIPQQVVQEWQDVATKTGAN